jgi:hypothetical protein
MPSSHSANRLVVAFDDDHAVANAGLLLAATLAQRLGIEVVVDQLVDLGGHPGHHRPGRRDAAGKGLGGRCRPRRCAHDHRLDPTICEVHGHHNGGAASGYTRQLGYHPLLATRADTGEVLHARQRTGRAASGRGAERFVVELAGRVRRAGATGPLTLRADSGFWSAKVLAACRRHRICFSITVRQTATVAAATASIPEQAWLDIDDPDGGIAQVAETILGGCAGR